MFKNKFICAWTNQAEWEYVYKNIFTDDTDKQQSAIDIINVWKTKFGSDIPIAIEATCALVQAKINSQNSPQPSNQHYNLAFALNQFVGLIVENSRRKSKSMFQVTESLNIPGYILKIRHQNSHWLPRSLEGVKPAVEWALNWLKTNHWDKIKLNQKQPSDGETFSNDPQTDQPMFFVFVKIVRCCIVAKAIIKNIFYNIVKNFLVEDESLVVVFVSSIVDGNFLTLEVDTGSYKPEENELIFSGFIRVVKELGYVHVFLNLLLRKFSEVDNEDYDDFLSTSIYILHCIDLLDAGQPTNPTLKKGLLSVWKNTVNLLTMHKKNKAFYSEKLQAHIQKIFGEETSFEISSIVHGEQPGRFFLNQKPTLDYNDFCTEISKNKQTSELSKHSFYVGDVFKNGSFFLPPHFEVQTAFEELLGKETETAKNKEHSTDNDLTVTVNEINDKPASTTGFNGKIDLTKTFGQI